MPCDLTLECDPNFTNKTFLFGHLHQILKSFLCSIGSIFTIEFQFRHNLMTSKNRLRLTLEGDLQSNIYSKKKQLFDKDKVFAD